MLAVLQTLPALNAPFTLVYRATLRDVRPKADKEARFDAVRRDLAARVEADALSSEAAARALADYRKLLDAPPVTTTLSLSYDGRTLLVDDAASATLVDQKGTFRFVKGPTDAVRGVWTPTPPTDVPFVGAALPFLATPKGVPTRDARKAVTKLAAPNDAWALSAHIPLRGTLVGRWIVRTTKETRAEYSLVSQLATALPADRFRPDRYASDGDEIAVAGRGNLLVDKRKGDLATQVAAMFPAP